MVCLEQESVADTVLSKDICITHCKIQGNYKRRSMCFLEALIELSRFAEAYMKIEGNRCGGIGGVRVEGGVVALINTFYLCTKHSIIFKNLNKTHNMHGST